MEPIIPTYTPDTSFGTYNDKGHWNAAKEDGLVRCNYESHTFKEDTSKSTPATCEHEGKSILVCSGCGAKVEKTTPKTEHQFNEISKNGVVHVEKDDGCGAVGYRLDIKEATGWNTDSSKWNEKSGEKAKASWDISDGKIPSGQYEINMSCAMTSSAHGYRTFYNQWETDTASQPDGQNQSPFRYYFSIDGGDDINPDQKMTWEELGMKDGANNTIFVSLVSRVTLPEGANTFSAFHGNIGYSLFVKAVRLVKNA